MSMFGGSTSRLASMGQRSNSRPDLSSSSFRNEVFMSGNGHKGGEFQMGDGGGGYSYKTSYSRSSTHGNTGGRKIQVSVGPVGGGGSGFVSGDEMIETTLQIRAICHEYLQRAKMILQSGGPPAEAEKMLALAGDRIEHLKTFGMELQQMRIPNDIFASVNQLEHMHGSIQQQLMGMMTIKWSTAGTLAATEGGRLFTDAMGWISQQKRMIQTAPWGENSATIDKQIMSHNKFHSTIQRSQEVDRARDELGLRGDKSNLYILEQEWESLQKMSHSRANQLRELQSIIEEISRAIMWVNEKEEEELVFDWGDKNIEQYIPKKQESYSRLMKDLEEKEKDLNKLKVKSDGLLSNNHPASDKIEAYIGILQTQWSWLLQITKCIHVHLKENAAYSQFFKEANETYEKLKKDRDNIQAKFTCNKNTPLENLKELLQHLEKEKERLMENKRQVQSLVNKSKTIVRLKPRNPEEPTTSGNPIMVQAVCDFKNDQKEILKGNEGILKDNTQRSKWLVTGPGGLDMLIPSVCLLISPPNPLSIGLAKKNEQYYEAILGIWNQLYINIKSLISWQYCIQDVNFINSLTLSMISKMRPEEYRSLIKKLEIHYQEFLHNSQSSDIFGEDDKLHIRNYFDKAQNHYDTLVIQLSGNKEESKPAPPKMQSLSIALLSSLQLLRQKLELAESGLTGHLHICSGENSLKDCLVHIEQLQIVHQDLEYIDDEYLRLREKIIKQLKGIPPESEQAKFLRSELEIIQQKLSGLRGLYSAYNERLSALKSLLESLLQVEDIVKVNEARLTEKETTSLDMRELGNYQSTLKQMKIELDYKKDLLTSIESELAKAVQSNGQVSESFHRCDVVLSKYAELVGHLSDRWRRIQSQIDTRLWDLEKHEKQLTNYQQKSASMDQWINNARKRQDSLQSGKLTNIQMVMDYLNQQKILYGEIKGKKDNVEDVQKDSDTYAGCIKDYELQLASYSSGLETLLNIPIKRTMLKSPATVIRQEASDLQSHYIELLTRSGDHYKFLGELLKNMEELKIRNTRIELLEEELRRLKEQLGDSGGKNKSQEDALARLKLELSQSKDQLISLEEVKRSISIQVSSAQETIEGAHGQIQDLNDQLKRIKYQLEEEKRKKRLAEERYTSQQEEYEGTVRRRQKELDELNWIKIDLEKTVNDKERELERLKILLEEEAALRRNAESDISKTSMMVHESQSKYSVVLLERDDLLSKLKLLEQDKLRQKRLEDELSRIKHSLETELRNKQRLIDEKNNVLKDFNLLKSQFELKETHLRQWELDRSKTDQDRLSLKNEIERLMRELRTVEERYKSRLMTSETEVTELSHKRDVLLREIEKLQRRPSTLSRQTQTDMKIATIDPSKLVFDGVRRKVTAHQLCDCGIISKATLELLLQGKKTVDEVAVDIQVNLKGRGIIAGMKTASQGKIPFTEAKNKNLLSPESALMLLEAQAATGYIADPAFNDKMPVDTACSRGIVDTQDRDSLIKAEAASVGFKDPHTGKVLSVGQACKKGRIDKEITLRLLQAQESVGGILDPVLSVFLPKDLALDRNLIDEELYRALNRKPALYIDPTTKENISYSDLRKKCSVEPVHGLLLLPCQEKPLTVKGIRGDVNVNKLVDSELITKSDWNKLTEGTITIQEIEKNLKSYLRGSTCIAGIYDEAKDRIYPFYQAMKEGMLMKGTTLELLEAQAASGFVVDPVNNVFLTVDEATERGLIGKEFKNKLLSAERAVTGYEDPSTREKISLFEAIEKELIERGHGIRLLEAQIASGGIIDPKGSHRIDVSVAYKRGYFDEEMNEILSYEGDDTKGFFDPNTKENLTYIQLKERCITDPQTGLVLLPLKDKTKAQTLQETRSNVLRKRRVVIVDPDTGLEMSIREAYNRELIDRDTFLDLSEQECEWEEITIKGSDGATRLVIVDRKTGTQYDIQDSLERGIVDQNTLDKYREGKLTLTQFADHVSSRSSSSEMTITTSSAEDVITCTSPTQARPSSPTVRKRFDSISITVSPPEMFDDQSPVAAVFDTETLEKITIPEAHRRGIVDTLTAQRLLEAQACTGGIINPATGQRLTLNEAVHQCVLDEAMANKLKASQKAYMGFEDVKTKRKMSAAEAVKETWLPYEAGQRFLEFQYLTGGLVDPSTGQRISMEEAIRKNWLDGLGAQKLQDARNYPKNLTCPKTKLKISYKEAMDGCMVEESNGMKLLQATSVSSKGLSSPYNVSNPSSRSGSRTGSRSGSRRGSVDYTSTYACSFSSISTGATY
ncbi:desmoplakin-A isoform X2 [Stigmatopora nigra]